VNSRVDQSLATRIATLVPALLAGMILTSCGSPNLTALPLGRAKASVIEGLPVPTKAVLELERPGESAIYNLVGEPIGSVNAWYNTRLPPGRNWNSWTWVSPNLRCLNLFHSKAEGRTWTNGNSTLDLETTAVASGTGVVVRVLPKSNSGFPVC
jgi:hypothetical protein